MTVTPSLLGVIIGGLITFFIQQSIVRKQQKWDGEKMKIDKFHQEQTIKFQTFNKILQLNGSYEVLEHNIHYGRELNQNKYTEHIRPLLFDIFHLLDETIVTNVNSIEDINERQFVMEEKAPSDKEALSNSYLEILRLINEQFKELRKSKLNDR
ncbi:hypothetical protein ACXYMX_16805 [Sporosarcina sp. CAU 1771]